MTCESISKSSRKIPPKKLLFIATITSIVLIITQRPHADFEEDMTVNSACKPAEKIAFMKTHKCASTIVENIIFRYTYFNDLNLVLPKDGNYLSWGTLFDKNSLRETEWKNLEFDVFTLHNRWNHKDVMALLGSETKTFSIVRDPVDVFESMYGYFKGLKEFYGNYTIQEFAKLVNGRQPHFLQKRFMNEFGRNQMAFDMGISPNIFDNDTAMDEAIQRLDGEFDLVLVAEMMDESLILLRHLLCWPMENIAHLNLNRRKPDKVVQLGDEERNMLKTWLKADYKIYDHFKKKFHEKLQQFNRPSSLTSWMLKSSKMERELKSLQLLNENLYEMCVLEEVGNEKLQGKFKETNDVITGFFVTETIPTCQFYAMSEPAYLSMFRESLAKKIRQQEPKDHQ